MTLYINVTMHIDCRSFHKLVVYSAQVMWFNHPTILSILFSLTIFGNAEIQLTEFVVKDKYSMHDCMQLLPCDHLQVLEAERKSECAHQALETGADIFIYEEGTKDCLLCQQTFPPDGFTAVHASLHVFVNGPEISNTSKLLFENRCRMIWFGWHIESWTK